MRLGLLSAAWLAGVLAGHSLSADPYAALPLAGAALLVAVGLRIARVPAFPALLAALLLLGLGRVEFAESREAAADFLGEEVTATGSIADDPETRSRFVRFELRVRSIEAGGEMHEADGRWLVYARPPGDLVSLRRPPYFLYGDSVVVSGTPLRPEPIDGFDYPAYLEAQGVTATMFAQDIRVTGGGGAQWRRAVFAVRGRLADSLERSMPYPESAVASAMLLGKRESLPSDLVDQFRGTGAAHLLAISGLHVGVLLAVVVGSAAWLLGRQHPAYLVVAGAMIWAYALIAGASPSALRAAVMGTVYLAALGVGRPSSALPALALAAAVMTAASPGLVRQVSFQLSFAAVGGIALALALLGGRLGWGASPTSGWLQRLLGWAAALAVVSLAATLATWPLVAANFGEVALLGVPASLLAIPAMAPLIVTSAGAAVAGVVAPAGTLLGWIAVAPVAWVVGVVSVLPAWTVESDRVSGPLLLGWYGALGAALLAAQPRWTRSWRSKIASGLAVFRAWSGGGSAPRPPGQARGGIPLRLPDARVTVPAAIALVVAAVILSLRLTGGADGNLHVYFLDIGQGDSTLIVTPAGRQVLVDGGPDGDVTSQRLAEVLPGGDRSLDLVVVTHLDSDHSHGLLEVLDRYAVGAVLSGPPVEAGAERPEWEQRLELHRLVPLEVGAGYIVQIDEGVELEVLNPDSLRPIGDSNNDSVAMRLTHGAVSVLLTADMEAEAEERLVHSGIGLSSTVLKAGHHGSATSTTQRFLDAVQPSIAVISAGADNPYGHPAPSVVQRLETAVGAQNVYRTARHGTVEVVSDGERAWVRTER